MLSKRAQNLLTALRLEAADSPLRPPAELGPMDLLMAEGELEKAGYIVVLKSGYRLTPKGVRGLDG